MKIKGMSFQIVITQKNENWNKKKKKNIDEVKLSKQASVLKLFNDGLGLQLVFLYKTMWLGWLFGKDCSKLFPLNK